MASPEFGLIDRYFKEPFAPLLARHTLQVPAGIGDDCAVLNPAPGHRLFVSTDTLVTGVHFYPDVSPVDLGWKSLAVNLSDLAACGAEPLGFTLALSLPELNPDWLTGFSKGLLSIAERYNCPLVGGDTTRANHATGLSITITVFGQAPASHPGFPRSAAQVGDQLWVQGLPGLARIGLLIEADQRGLLGTLLSSPPPVWSSFRAGLPPELCHRASRQLNQPQPQVELGHQLRGIAHACLDTSDGLSGDVAHIAKASQLALVLNESALIEAWHREFPQWCGQLDAASLTFLLDCAVTGGDDYSLCFTAPPSANEAILQLSDNHSLFALGEVRAGQGVWLQALAGSASNPVPLNSRSFTHF
ncbi:MAG TPA: thiamine-phosphate kinase [Limnobacter sp.]|uniref:thiamine-phosphate kinase n=1 Tax=Limnobacter sp. TaxID=2003368 RepID=UPI002ED8D516